MSLQAAATRNCFWSPDYSFLSLLVPQPGRVLQVSPPLLINVQDASNQSLAASTTSNFQWSANTLVAGSWVAPNANQAVMFESLAFGVQATDNSGKLQLSAAFLGLGDTVTKLPMFSPAVLPFTFSAVNNQQVFFSGQLPIALLVPRPVGTPSPNGPNGNITITNTDGASAHTFKRVLQMTYRIIDQVDWSTGPTLPGAGLARTA